MDNSSKEFAGKKALVTGGSKGMGAAVARILIDRGASVVVSARTIHEQTPPEAIFIGADLRTKEGAESLAEQTLKSLGGLDILVNSAGATVPRLRGIDAISEEEWMESLMINFMSAVRVTHPLLGALRQSDKGVIVNVTAGGLLPFHGFLAHYGAAKAALTSYTRSLALDLAPSGIRVNLVTPGAIRTPGGDAGRDELTAALGITHDQLYAAIPQRRAGSAEEMAEAIIFLVSEKSSYITGDNLFVGGGWGNLV